jgi:hypothetical protein
MTIECYESYCPFHPKDEPFCQEQECRCRGWFEKLSQLRAELAAAKEKNESYRQLLDVRDKQLAAAREDNKILANGTIETAKAMRYTAGIAERGLGEQWADTDEGLGQFVLRYVKQLEADNAALRKIVAAYQLLASGDSEAMNLVVDALLAYEEGKVE